MRKQSKSDTKQRTILELCKTYYARKGFRVSTIKETPDGHYIVRFPDGGPSGLKKTLHNESSIQSMRCFLEDQ